MATASPGRLGGLDALKAAAILGVVLIHAAPLAPSAYQQHVVNGVARLAVPAFLLITGLLAGLKQTEPTRFRGYFARFLRLHVIYALVYWLVDVARRGPIEAPTLKSALMRFGEAAWPGQYYFLILVQIFFLVAFVLPPAFWRAPVSVVSTGAVAVAGMLALAAAGTLPDTGTTANLLLRRVAGSGSGVWLWLYYFTLGAFLGERLRAGRLPSWLTDARAGAAWLAGAVALAAAGWPPGGDARVDAYARTSIFAAATLVGFSLPSLAGTRGPRWLARIGVDSFGVFVLNPVLLWTLYALLGIERDPWTSWIVAGVAVAIALPITALLRRWAPSLLA